MNNPTRRLRLTNLNLLPILNAVLKHQNLTRAAEELNLTQSAVSNSLKQLRAHFDDDLLVRDGRNLRLTDKARQLIEPLERALNSVDEVFADAPFEPATSTHRFRIATADYVGAALAPGMAAAMSQEAPKTMIQLIAAHAHSAFDLRKEEVDLVIGPRQIVEAVIARNPEFAGLNVMEPIGREPVVCLARDNDTAFAKGLDVENYFARPHASFDLDEATPSLEHDYLCERNVAQFNRVLTADYLVLPFIAARSDCIVLVPLSVAQMAAGFLPLRIGRPPLPFPEVELVMVWLRRRKDEPELSWLRDLLRRCVNGFLGGKAIRQHRKRRQFG